MSDAYIQVHFRSDFIMEANTMYPKMTYTFFASFCHSNRSFTLPQIYSFKSNLKTLHTAKELVSYYLPPTKWYIKLEDLKVLRRSPDLFNNVNTDQGLTAYNK